MMVQTLRSDEDTAAAPSVEVAIATIDFITCSHVAVHEDLVCGVSVIPVIVIRIVISISIIIGVVGKKFLQPSQCAKHSIHGIIHGILQQPLRHHLS
jgi:hypothetical protein